MSVKDLCARARLTGSHWQGADRRARLAGSQWRGTADEWQAGKLEAMRWQRAAIKLAVKTRRSLLRHVTIIVTGRWHPARRRTVLPPAGTDQGAHRSRLHTFHRLSPLMWAGCYNIAIVCWGRVVAMISSVLSVVTATVPATVVMVIRRLIVYIFVFWNGRKTEVCRSRTPWVGVGLLLWNFNVIQTCIKIYHFLTINIWLHIHLGQNVSTSYCVGLRSLRVK